MTILPLITRELRRRSRSRAVYWTRFAVALVGIFICLTTLTMSGMRPGNSQALLGHSAFQGIIMAAFILCCCAGFLTLDGISRERREGTLGLLCLTRVKALDVLLGSFGAAGIACVCALAGLLPVIMLPVLTGGVTGGEVFRTMLALFDTLLLSLTAGLWSSAGARGWFQSARAAVALLLLIIVVPAIFAPLPYIYQISPLGAFHWSKDGRYQSSPATYWMSLAVVHGISWLLLIGAGFRLRRAMREGDGIALGVDPARPRGFTPVAWKLGSPKMMDADDPIRWLVRRQRGIKAVIWAGALAGLIRISAFWWLLLWIRSSPFVYNLSSPLDLAIYVMEGSLFGWAASRFFAEGRRTGELEMLLTSPVGAATVVSSQWREIRRQFAWPVIVMVVADVLVQAWVLFGGEFGNSFWAMGWRYGVYSLISPALSFVNIVLNIGALVWVALWFGLRARSQAAALVRIILLAQGVPFLISFAGARLVRLTVNASVTYNNGVYYMPWGFWLYLLPQVAILFYYLWLMRWARRRLVTDLTNPSPDEFSLITSIAEARGKLASFIDKSRHRPPAAGR